ncbi:MAG: PEGA domain-containing protein [Pseudomonadota bacterium]
MTRSCIFIAAAALFLLSNAAIAQKGAGEGTEEKRKAEAKEKFKKGIEYFKNESYASALVEFKNSYDLSPKSSVLFNIALCEKALFRYDSSIETFRKYMAEAKKISEQEREEIAAHIKEMEQLAAKLMVLTDPEGVEITIDGKTKFKTPLKTAVLLGPGEHTVEARKEGYESVSKSLILSEGVKREIPIKLEKLKKVSILTVMGSDKDAVASIDGGEKKSLPADFKVEAGKHVLAAEAPGMIPEEREVTIGEGEKLVLDIGLTPIKGTEGKGEPKKAKKPVYKNPWLWSILAVAVAAGAGVGIYYGVAGTGGESRVIREITPP